VETSQEKGHLTVTISCNWIRLVCFAAFSIHRCPFRNTTWVLTFMLILRTTWPPLHMAPPQLLREYSVPRFMSSIEVWSHYHFPAMYQGLKLSFWNWEKVSYPPRSAFATLFPRKFVHPVCLRHARFRLSGSFSLLRIFSFVEFLGGFLPANTLTLAIECLRLYGGFRPYILVA
jgi:hypothetical protein